MCEGTYKAFTKECNKKYTNDFTKECTKECIKKWRNEHTQECTKVCTKSNIR